MPLPAGTGMDRRAFLLRSVGARCCRSTAPPRSRPATSKTGIAQAAAAHAQPAGARVDLHGRRLGRAVGARARQGSALPRTAPHARARRRRRGAVHRGRRPDVAPRGRRPRHSCTARARSRCSRRSATTRPTRATSPAATTGRSGELDTQTRSGWMGRYLDVAGEPGNPLQGLSLDYSLAPALATDQGAGRRRLLAL